jgi:hypothetical protein
MNRQQLAEKLRSTNLMDFVKSPYAGTLKGKAAEQFQLLAESKGKIAEDNLEDYKPLAIAGMSVEIKSMSANFSGTNTPWSDRKVIVQAKKSVDDLYKNLDNDGEEDEEEDVNPADLPIRNQDRFPDVAWQTPEQVGMVDGSPAYLLGTEAHGEKIIAVVQSDNPEYLFAQPVSELIGHTYGKIELDFGEQPRTHL